MFRYFYSITTAEKIDDLDKYDSEIREKVKEFNKNSNVARTYKNIIIDTLVIKNDRIEFEMETKDDLGVTLSLRPLHLLSKFLLEVPGLNEKCINKRFLKPIIIKSLQQQDDFDDLTDIEVLKTIIEVYMSNKHTKESNKFRESLKKITKEFLS